MDIKSRKYRPFVAWLCFFLGVSIIGVLLFIALDSTVNSRDDMDVFQSAFQNDYKNSSVFKKQTSNYFNSLYSLVDDNLYHDKDYQNISKNILNYEGINLKYYAVNHYTGLTVKNIEDVYLLLPKSKGLPVLPADYKYFWYFDGQKLSVMDHGQLVDVEQLDSGYSEIIPNLSIYSNSTAKPRNIQVVLAVRDTLVKEPNPYSQSKYYWDQQFLSILGRAYIVLAVLGIALLIYALINRRDKREFDRKLAFWSGKVWKELKILLSILLLVLMVALIPMFGPIYDNLYTLVAVIPPLIMVILLGLWWFYVMIVDLIVNRSSFFSHNFIKWYQIYKSKYSWQQSMLKQAYILIATAVLSILLVIFLVIALDLAGEFLLATLIMIAGAGIYLLYRYLRRYKQTISDLGQLIDHIELIKNGDMESRLELATEADMYTAAQNLNTLQESMSIIIAEKMKSERMKIELITNVSHDLKTPLTSIISYVDLLGKEDDLPEHVNDYIKILAQKSERLKNLIQDLFDLSKASSGNVTLAMEQLDLARLIKQTLADMEEPISASGLTFRQNIPDEPVYILSDGKKLYRVWENLIANALKYSLPGSRVFVDLTVDGNTTLATIKNTASEEMNFGEDEILQRFVRGDSARTTEGSGLGLSIAQSFTEICGGRFGIKIDGDLFKVEQLFNTDKGEDKGTVHLSW